MAAFDLELDGFAETLEELERLEERFADDSTWLIGTRVEYAIYLELGTSKMDPKPFIRPALAEVRMQGVDGFIDHNTRTDVDDIDSTPELIRTLALALERRIKQIITAKGLIDTGTLRASIAAVPIEQQGKLPTADDIQFDEEGNALDFRQTADIEVSV